MRYKIQGDNMPVVICELNSGESMICEAGAMSWMSPNMEMETKSRGGIGGFFGRALSGESGFQNFFTARNGNGMIAFTSSYVGNILAVDITPDKPIIIQKRAFLACTTGVDMEVFFQKKIGTALFGGEASAENGRLNVSIPGCSGEIWIPEDRSADYTPLRETAEEFRQETAPDVSADGAGTGAAYEPQRAADSSKPYEEMSVEELQAEILAKMAANGPVTDQMKRDVMENVYRDSLLNWVRSFNR